MKNSLKVRIICKFNKIILKDLDEAEITKNIKELQLQLISSGLNSLKVNSPLATILIDQNFYRCKSKSLKEVFESDFELMKQLLNEPEFYIGVENLLIKRGKEHPNWMFDSFEKVPSELVYSLMNKEDPNLKLDLD